MISVIVSLGQLVAEVEAGLGVAEHPQQRCLTPCCPLYHSLFKRSREKSGSDLRISQRQNNYVLFPM